MDGLERSRREVVACRRMRHFALVLLLIAVVAFGSTPASAQAALETTIDSGPAGPTNNSAPTFTFSTIDPNAVAFDCSMDSDPFAPCTSPFTAPVLAEGSHTFSVTARDAAGNVGAPQVQSFVVDVTPPATSIDSGPAGPTNDQAPTFTFSATEANAVAFDCAMDSDPFAPCTSPFAAPTLAEGSHTFSVTARDAAGNVGAPQVQSFLVDITLPVVSIDSGPPAFTNSTTASFTFSATDDVSLGDTLGFQCRLSFQTFDPCTSRKEYTPLPEGQYTFRVRVIDEAGNVSAAAIYAWTVDLTPPGTTIDTVPPNPTSNPTTTFTFSSDDPSATFECHMDAQEFVPCSSPWGSGALSEGSHIFTVRATDLAGNVDSSPASLAFRVDTKQPPPVSDAPPSSSPPHSPQPSADPITASLVRVSKRPIRVTRKRVAPVTMRCASTKSCAGVVRLTTARRGRSVRLGYTRFAVRARKTAQVRVRLSEESFRLVKKLRRANVLVTVRQRDSAGHLRIRTRKIVLIVR
jgi:hypothetical protein